MDVFREIPAPELRGSGFVIGDDGFEIRDAILLQSMESLSDFAKIRQVGTQGPHGIDKRQPSASFPLLTEVEDVDRRILIVEFAIFDRLVSDDQFCFSLAAEFRMKS